MNLLERKQQRLAAIEDAKAKAAEKAEKKAQAQRKAASKTVKSEQNDSASFVSNLLAKKASRSNDKPAAKVAQPNRGGDSQTATPEPASTGNQLTALEQHQAAIKAHRAALKELDTVEQKQALKAKLLEEYQPYLQEYMQQGHCYPNSVAVECMVWMFDCGLIEEAVQWALLLMQQNESETLHVSPKHFNRNLPTLIVDAVFDWGNALQKQQQSCQPYIDDVINAFEHWDINPILKGKMHKLAGQQAELQNELEQAVKHYQTAQAINEKAGAKKLLKDAQAKLDAQS